MTSDKKNICFPHRCVFPAEAGRMRLSGTGFAGRILQRYRLALQAPGPLLFFYLQTQRPGATPGSRFVTVVRNFYTFLRSCRTFAHSEQLRRNITIVRNDSLFYSTGRVYANRKNVLHSPVRQFLLQTAPQRFYLDSRSSVSTSAGKSGQRSETVKKSSAGQAGKGAHAQQAMAPGESSVYLQPQINMILRSALPSVVASKVELSRQVYLRNYNGPAGIPKIGSEGIAPAVGLPNMQTGTDNYMPYYTVIPADKPERSDPGRKSASLSVLHLRYFSRISPLKTISAAGLQQDYEVGLPPFAKVFLKYYRQSKSAFGHSVGAVPDSKNDAVQKTRLLQKNVSGNVKIIQASPIRKSLPQTASKSGAFPLDTAVFSAASPPLLQAKPARDFSRLSVRKIMQAAVGSPVFTQVGKGSPMLRKSQLPKDAGVRAASKQFPVPAMPNLSAGRMWIPKTKAFITSVARQLTTYRTTDRLLQVTGQTVVWAIPRATGEKRSERLLFHDVSGQPRYRKIADRDGKSRLVYRQPAPGSAGARAAATADNPAIASVVSDSRGNSGQPPSDAAAVRETLVEQSQKTVREYLRKMEHHEVSIVAEKVYDILEKRLHVEQERRGWA